MDTTEGASDFEFEYDDPFGWIKAQGGGLPRPVHIRIRNSVRGPAVIGLTIEGTDAITSAELRAIPIGRLTDALNREFFDYLQRTESGLMADPYFRHHLSRRPDRRGMRMAEDEYAEAMNAMQADIESMARWWSEGRSDLQARGRGAKPPTDLEYEQFAHLYRTELAKGARGAKKRTAERAAMDRGTAYRWIAECQKRGLLPQDEE